MINKISLYFINMSSFYDQRSKELLGTVNDYSQNLNSITQQNLQSSISSIGGLKQMQDITTQTLAGGKEAQLTKIVQDHMEKMGSELGIDMSVSGVGKPVLSYTSKKIKGFAEDRIAKAKEAISKKLPGQESDPENIRGTKPAPEPAADSGTELSDFSGRSNIARPAGDLPSARPQGNLDRSPRQNNIEEDEDDEPPVEPPSTSSIPTSTTQDLGTAGDDLPSVASDLNPFQSGSVPITPRAATSELSDFSNLPDSLGWRSGIHTGAGDPLSGPGDFPEVEPINASALNTNALNEVPQMGGGRTSYLTDRAQNPFRLQGSDLDTSVLRKGPPADLPEIPQGKFQFQRPTQPRAGDLDAGSAATDDAGSSLIQPASIQQGRVLPQGAGGGEQEARDKLAQALKGGKRPAQVDDEPEADAPEPQLAGPSRTGGRFADTGAEAPPAPPRNAPGGPDGPPIQQTESDPLQRPTAPEPSSNVSTQVESEQTNISESMASDSRQAADSLSQRVEGAATDAEDVGKSLAEKAGTALSEITGSDVLGGFGSFLGIAGDFLGPVMGGIGLYEAAKGAADAENDADSDPYAAVKKIIAQGQTKMAGLDADISSDQFAEKIGGTRAPAFGSLAAPVFSTQGLTGMSQHF